MKFTRVLGYKVIVTMNIAALSRILQRQQATQRMETT